MAVHRCHRDLSAGASSWRTPQKGGPQAQALGRSRGGFGSKIHAVVDALGLPVRFHLGPGQQNDMAPACDLVRGLPAKQVLADRAYDADSLHDIILDQGGEPVIPPRRHRKPADGIVTFVKDISDIGGPNPAYWEYTNFIVIMHSNGEYSRYDHLSHNSSTVKVGQNVRAGEEIVERSV